MEACKHRGGQDLLYTLPIQEGLDIVYVPNRLDCDGADMR